MRLRFLFPAGVAGLALAISAHAQQEQREPLTQAQIEEIREAGIYPADRIKLYTKYLGERADGLKALVSRARSEARAQRIDNELKDFTALMDELGSNLDQYGDRHADIRAALKPLNEAIPGWEAILRALPGEMSFDLSRKDALEAIDDLADQAKHLQDEQNEYFRTHKEEKGQERAEPK